MLPENGVEPLDVRRARCAGWAVALVMVLMLLPTLRWLEFSYGIESIHVATVLEMERTDQWLAPTLNDAPRIKKPPLPGWISAAFVSDDLMQRLDAASASSDDPAYQALAWRVRLPALLACAIAVGLICEIGIIIGGGRVGFFSALVAAGAALFIHKHARQALPDVYLTLFYALAMLGLVRALFAGRRDGWLIAGVALGLGLMCKGPVVLLQALVPAIVARVVLGGVPLSPRRHASAIVGGIALMLAIGLWWYVLIALRDPEVLRTWYQEVSRDDALQQDPGNPLIYLSLIAWMHPWIWLILCGIGLLIVRRRQITRLGHLRAAMFGLMGAALPLALMAIAKDRKERYMLPMLLPASIGVAGVLVEHLWGLRQRKWFDRVSAVITCLLIAGVVMLIPWLGGVLKPQLDPTPGWLRDIPDYTKRTADILVISGGGLIALCIWLHFKRPQAGFVMACLLSLWGAVVFAHGYRHTDAGLSELRPLAEVIRRDAPDARVHFRVSEGDTATSNLAIYLNKPVPELPEPERATPQDVPLVVILDRRKGNPPPPTQAWRELWRNKPIDPTRVAFVLEAR